MTTTGSFTDDEIAYLQSQRLCRIATVAPDGQPDVTPVGYQFDGTHFYLSGIDPEHTRRFRNVRAGNDKIALVVDDLPSVQPWTPRFLRIYGRAELLDKDEQSGGRARMRVTPLISWSWNLDGRPFSDGRATAGGYAQAGPRKAVHQLPAS